MYCRTRIRRKKHRIKERNKTWKNKCLLWVTLFLIMYFHSNLRVNHHLLILDEKKQSLNTRWRYNHLEDEERWNDISATLLFMIFICSKKCFVMHCANFSAGSHDNVDLQLHCHTFFHFQQFVVFTVEPMSENIFLSPNENCHNWKS